MKYLEKIMTEATKRNIPLFKLADSIGMTESGLKMALINDTLRVDQLNTICEELRIEVGNVFIVEKSSKMKSLYDFHFMNNKVFC